VSTASPDEANPVAPASWPRRLATAAVLVVVLLIVPVGMAVVLFGRAALTAASLGVLFAFLLGLRAGWRSTALALPGLLAVAALAAATAGSWGWVALLVLLGGGAAAASTVGWLAPVALAGVLAASAAGLEPGAALLWEIPVAAAAGGYAVVVLRAVGVPAAVPEPRVPPRLALMVAPAVMAVVAAAATLALGWDDPFAYWLPAFVFLLVLPVPGLALAHQARARILGAAAGVAVLLPVAVLAPPPGVLLPVTILVLLLVVAVPEPLWLNAMLSTLLLGLALDPGTRGLAAGETRLVAAVLAGLLVLAAALALTRWSRWQEALAGEQARMVALVAVSTRPRGAARVGREGSTP
jgi:hypothetical protein